MEDEELEYVLLNKREVFVYQIPPASSAQGHKADEWKNCIWRGRIQIKGRGKHLAVELLDPTSGDLFARCDIPNGEHEKFVQRTVDSSRYFVLKISNQNRHTFIGIGFEDRNDAFDFNCQLADFKHTFVENAAQQAPKPDVPARDLSLKEGQKISVKLPAGHTSRRDKQKDTGSAGAFPAPPGGGLAPPPGGGQSRRQQPSGGYGGGGFAPPPSGGGFAQAAPQAQPAAAPAMAPQGGAGGSPWGDDDFGDFECAFQSAPPAAAPAPSMPSNSAASPFGGAAPATGASAGPFGGAAYTAPASNDPFADLTGPGPAPASRPASAAAPAPGAGAAAPWPGAGGAAPWPGASGSPAAAPWPGAPGSGAPSQGSAPPSQEAPKKAANPFDEFDIFK